MKFTKYIFDLYKNSDEGKIYLDLFNKTSEKINIYPKKNKSPEILFLPKWGDDLILKYNFLNNHIEKISEKLGIYLDKEFIFLVIEYLIENNDIELDEELYTYYYHIITNGLYFQEYENNKWEDFCFTGLDEDISSTFWFDNFYELSLAFYIVYPDYFFPYLFNSFIDLLKIFREFNIDIPDFPAKNNKEERLMYYIQLCESLNELKKDLNLSNEELCAFLYSFAPNSLKEFSKNKEIPLPKRVWGITGDNKHNKNDFNSADTATFDDTRYWTGSDKIREGDIVLMYLGAPRSYFHSIWRAKSDGITEMFWHRGQMVEITNKISIPILTLNEMKNDSILSQSTFVKSNMQGLSNKNIKYSEYEKILDILKNKGMDISVLPKIENNFYVNEELKNERDIEITLVEPLLEKLEYEDSDWLRQMPLTMGRGERNYPDYCIGAINKKGEERAKLIIETKFKIKSDKELEKAYFQASSYALRLQAKKFVVASLEGIWIFEITSNGDYSLEKKLFFNWNELNEQDKFYNLSKLIGKKYILK